MISAIIDKALSLLDVGDILKLTDTIVGEIQTNRNIELGGNRVELEQYRHLSSLLDSGMVAKRQAESDVSDGSLTTDRYERVSDA